MSTRCTINFGETYKDEFHNVAKIYRHSDGYPDSEYGVPACLSQFFKDVENQTMDTRFNDPSYLAAKFVVWQAGQYARDSNAPLAFSSLGVLLEDPGDIEYTYFVDCGKRDENGYPTVTYRGV
jgi:hypothetical protein